MTDWTTEKIAALLEPLTGYTPGPWWTNARYDGRDACCAVIAARTDAGPLPGNPTRGVVAFSSALLNTEARKCEADARLIAAAPDLIDALRAVAAERDAALAHAEKAEAEVARLRDDKALLLIDCNTLRARLAQKEDT